MFSHSSLVYSLQNYLFINNNNPFSFGGKKPSKTQINQKAIFQYVKFLLFYNLSIKNKIPINQLQTKMHVPACICSLFAHYLSLSTFNITLQPFEANRDKSTCKAECICLYSQRVPLLDDLMFLNQLFVSQFMYNFFETANKIK